MKRKDSTLVKFLVLILVLLILRVGVVTRAFKSDNIGLKYKEVKVNKSLTIPKFNDRNLNRLINEYIKENSCEKLDYNIFI